MLILLNQIPHIFQIFDTLDNCNIIYGVIENSIKNEAIPDTAANE